MQFQQAGRFIMNKLRKELPRHLSYHSADHIKDVYEAAKRLGKQENLTGYEIKLVLTAAWYHDAGFLKGAKNHEEDSCNIAKTALPDFGYDPGEIDLICGMIMATKIPQSPKNHLEEILADADLDYLGRDDFFTIGNKLFTELSLLGFLNTEDEWNSLQVSFLESHHYFTKTALQWRQAKKQQHLAEVKAKLKH